MNNNIEREIADSLEADMFKGKVIVLTGARQVGKTTLILNKRLSRPSHFKMSSISLRVTSLRDLKYSSASVRFLSV